MSEISQKIKSVIRFVIRVTTMRNQRKVRLSQKRNSAHEFNKNSQMITIPTTDNRVALQRNTAKKDEEIKDNKRQTMKHHLQLQEYQTTSNQYQKKKETQSKATRKPFTFIAECCDAL
eukprot:2909185-Amphidinium_carterae.2